eukprot:TRINITY_DN6037_c0_g1_i1.p1 TRINITY_DN6037_c0_g1~~TRINITY_DN6037_c0_g1_i1.p1  ORF type:complete len:687 (-),score=156.73 TRINITY_DN6037_c0_g1_i1:48-2108(-)
MLKPRVTLGDIWDNIQGTLIKDVQHLKNHLILTCSSIGVNIDSREYSISKDNTKTTSPGMIFNVRIGFHNLKREDTLYSLLLSDTVLVTKNGGISITKDIPKDIVDISYDFKQEESDDMSIEEISAIEVDTKRKKGEIKPQKQNSVLSDHGFSLRREETMESIQVGRRTLRNTKAREAKHFHAENEAKRLEDQKEIAKALRRKALKDLKEKSHRKEPEKEVVKVPISYQSHDKFDATLNYETVAIDKTNETIFVPIFGRPVPYHIDWIKKASVEDNSYLRLAFEIPSNSKAKNKKIFPDPHKIFLKEILINFEEVSHLNSLCIRITTMKKERNKKLKSKQLRENIVEQPILLRSQDPIKLNGVFMKPYLSGRKTQGNLEVHTNGFRLSSNKGTCDVIYENVKHAFFQPSENSLLTLIHLHLHNPIIIGTKKTTDIQFYTEVIESSQAVSNNKYYAEASEREAEERQKRYIQSVNSKYLSFVEQVEEKISGFKFEKPDSGLEFSGVPYRDSVPLLPSENCLVNLTENPPFVVSLPEIQIVVFERVQFNLREFDISIVYHDWTKKVTTIRAVDIGQLEVLKTWLNGTGKKYYELDRNVNFNSLLSTVSMDPKSFWKEGGWDIYLNNQQQHQESYSDSDEYVDGMEYRDSEKENYVSEPSKKKRKKRKRKRESESETEHQTRKKRKVVV